MSEDPNAPHSFADQAFVRSTLERGNAELQLGQLTQEKGQSDDVKALGQHMVDGTNRVDDGFKALASAINVGLPKEPSKKDKQAIAKLHALSGPQFDEQSIKMLMKYKRQDEKEFQLESGSAEDPNVQHAAAQDAPVVAAHLKEIEQVAQAHKITVDGKD
jgi:putative membrane protein